MSETSAQRSERQFINYKWRSGRPDREADATSWTLPHRETVILEQACDERSQFEWYALPTPNINHRGKTP